MTFTENHTEEQKQKVELAQKILGYEFKNPEILLAAITHPSATEGKPVKFSYERLEFLGDSILGAVVASEAFNTYHEIDEGGLTRIKVALVSGASLSDVAEKLGFADIIVFGPPNAAQVVAACTRRLKTCTKPLSQLLVSRCRHRRRAALHRTHAYSAHEHRYGERA